MEYLLVDRGHNLSILKFTPVPCTPTFAILPKTPSARVSHSKSHTRTAQLTSNPHELLTHIKSLRHPHRLHHNIKPILIPKPPLTHLPRFRITPHLIALRRPHLLRLLQPPSIAVKAHHSLRRVQISANHARQAHGSCPDYGDRAAGFDQPAQDGDFEARGQDVGVDEEAALVGAGGDGVEAGVCEGDAEVFGLGAVDGVAEGPAAGFAGVVEAGGVS